MESLLIVTVVIGLAALLLWRQRRSSTVRVKERNLVKTILALV